MACQAQRMLAEQQAACTLSAPFPCRRILDGSAVTSPGSKTLRMSDVHEASYAADSDTLTFDLASFLHLPKGRITTARVRWVQAPMAPSGAVGAQARAPSFRTLPQRGLPCVAKHMALCRLGMLGG